MKMIKKNTVRKAFLFAIGVYMIVWGISCYNTGEFIHLTMGDAIFFAVLFGGKGAEKYIENKDNEK